MNILTPSQSARRDWYLNHLGITQYDLRNPQALRGEIVTMLSDDTRLVIVAESFYPELPFFNDIVNAANLTKTSWFFIKPTKATLLPDNLNCIIWIMGIKPTINLTAKSSAIIHTESLTNLMNSTSNKRLLWQKLCQYDHYFQTRNL